MTKYLHRPTLGVFCHCLCGSGSQPFLACDSNQSDVCSQSLFHRFYVSVSFKRSEMRCLETVQFRKGQEDKQNLSAEVLSLFLIHQFINASTTLSFRLLIIYLAHHI